jgi:hypothetical protein
MQNNPFFGMFFIKNFAKNIKNIKMRKILIYVALCLFAVKGYGQSNTIGQFAIWKPKEGQLQNFENGYKQHLNWHKSNGDKWSWYGWFVVSGTHYGQFVDATFDHTWADFDKAVKPAEDVADNRFHVFPFGDVQTFFKVSNYAKASIVDTFAMKIKLIKLVTLTVDDIEQSLKMTEKMKDFYVSKQIKVFKTYKLVDGGATNQIIIMMGFSNWEEYSMSETLNEKVIEFEQILKTKSVSSINSETMLYRADMSLFPN